MELGLVTMLRAAWIAAIIPILIALIPSSKLGCFHEFLLGFAKRGKIMQSSNNKFTVPQKFFCQFYILATLWTTLLLVAMSLYAYMTTTVISESSLFSSIVSDLTGGSHILSLHTSNSSKENRRKVLLSVFLLLLMETQALRRLYESIYVFKYSPSARMHILGYFAGLFFYTAAPLSLCCNFALEVLKFIVSLVQEFIVEGNDRMQVTEFDWWGFVSPLMQLRWYAWVGAAIFFWGWIHQHCCHAILGKLRKNREQFDDYMIPHGDWFEYVSSPHYLAEIVIYGGLVVASGCLDLTVWLLFSFVVVNLVLAATETHRWYLRKFDNYPKNRFAILPFLY
ncbi:polyprenol reductase 2-like [Ipomoea triloba]|uniref:polyprenol reductase 2-like n=1 Tax=Ipomoea triloba TaxID=35885 RepID=UPI00125E9962|nr:polyprenol reductase 2-like [Ipomoea triloba]XP_031125749.1 polyprenol reductase 2-like [Ipomoea triloba]